MSIFNNLKLRTYILFKTMKKEKTTLAQRLRALRDHYGLSQSEFASFIGMKGHQGILKIESGGVTEPRKSTIENIAEVYGTTYDWLMEGKGEMLPDGDKNPVKIGTQISEPWKDEAWAIAKSQLEKKDQTIDRLSVSFERLTEFLNRVEGSFLHPVAKTG